MTAENRADNTAVAAATPQNSPAAESPASHRQRDLLAQIHSEIVSRLFHLQPFADEYHRLQACQRALGDTD